MRSLLIAAGLAVGLAGAAHAMPVNALAQPSGTILVAGGCGVGWHRGPRGGCIRNWARPWRHPCPRGYHLGPAGRCRANWR